MSKGAWRYAALANNTRAVKQFCNKYQFRVEPFNNGYQLRIEEVLDVYPVRQRWHYLPTGERGDWNNTDDLKRVLLDRLPEVGIARVTNNPDTVNQVRIEHTPKGKNPFWKFWKNHNKNY